MDRYATHLFATAYAVALDTTTGQLLAVRVPMRAHGAGELLFA